MFKIFCMYLYQHLLPSFFYLVSLWCYSEAWAHYWASQTTQLPLIRCVDREYHWNITCGKHFSKRIKKGAYLFFIYLFYFYFLGKILGKYQESHRMFKERLRNISGVCLCFENQTMLVKHIQVYRRIYFSCNFVVHLVQSPELERWHVCIISVITVTCYLLFLISLCYTEILSQWPWWRTWLSCSSGLSSHISTAPWLPLFLDIRYTHLQLKAINCFLKNAFAEYLCNIFIYRFQTGWKIWCYETCEIYILDLFYYSIIL